MMEIRPVGPGFAAEVHGCGLAEVAADDAAYRAVRAAFEEEGVPLLVVAPCSAREAALASPLQIGIAVGAQIEIALDTKPGHEAAYELLFMAKGGGSANKSYLFQETKALLNPESFARFLDEKLRSLGTAACPPYHLAVEIGRAHV